MNHALEFFPHETIGMNRRREGKDRAIRHIGEDKRNKEETTPIFSIGKSISRAEKSRNIIMSLENIDAQITELP